MDLSGGTNPYGGADFPRSMRAFVAVAVPPEEALLRLLEDLAATGADVRAVPPGQLHFTLSFLGEVPDEAADALAGALDEAVRGATAFPLALHGVGAFPNPRHPRVVWAGTRDEPRFRALAAAVRARLAAVGHPGDDKPFRAHLTLGRVRSPRGEARLVAFLDERKDLPLPTIPVASVRLYRSRLGRGGAQHEILHETPLEA